MGVETAAIVAADLWMPAAAAAIEAGTVALVAESAIAGVASGALAGEVAGEALGGSAAELIESGAVGAEGAAMEAAALGEVGASALGGSAAELIESGATGAEGAAMETAAAETATLSNPTTAGQITRVGTSAADTGQSLAQKMLEEKPKKGVIDSIINWAGTKAGGLALGQMGAGALQGIGASYGAQEAAKTKAESDQALLEKQTDERLRMSREGTYSGGNVRPSGKKVLYTADGRPVYVSGGGLISNQMKI